MRHIKYLFILLFITLVVISAELILGLSNSLFVQGMSKQNTYQLGRMSASLHFILIYICILCRLLLANLSDSGTKKVIYSIIVLMTVSIIPVSLYLITMKSEIIGIDHVMMDYFLKGIISMMPAVGIIMAFTPFVIPTEILKNTSQFFNKKNETTAQQFDSYLNESEKIDKEEPEVLIIEDDISCAAPMLRFFKKLNLRCRHVKSIGQAQILLEEFKYTIRLIILDNFVRTEEVNPNYKTGIEWAKYLQKELSEEERHFKIVMITGHVQLLKDVNGAVDMVLEKPWDPKDLLKFITENQLI